MTVFMRPGECSSSGWMANCPAAAWLPWFHKNGISATIWFVISGIFCIILHFIAFPSPFYFELNHILLFTQKNTLWRIGFWSPGGHSEATSCRLLNFWNIFRQEIYNGIMENRSVENRHDYKGGIVLQGSRSVVRAASRRFQEWKQKTLLLLAQNPLDFET